METICLDAKKSSMCGASICSGGKAMSRACKISGVGSCSEATGWGFESIPVPCDVPRQWTSIAWVLTRVSSAQSEGEGRSGLPFTHRFELRVSWVNKVALLWVR